MLIFLLVVLIIEVAIIGFFIYYALYQPFTATKRDIFIKELKEQIRFEHDVLKQE